MQSDLAIAPSRYLLSILLRDGWGGKSNENVMPARSSGTIIHTRGRFAVGGIVRSQGRLDVRKASSRQVYSRLATTTPRPGNSGPEHLELSSPVTILTPVTIALQPARPSTPLLLILSRAEQSHRGAAARGCASFHFAYLPILISVCEPHPWAVLEDAQGWPRDGRLSRSHSSVTRSRRSSRPFPLSKRQQSDQLVGHPEEPVLLRAECCLPAAATAGALGGMCRA